MNMVFVMRVDFKGAGDLRGPNVASLKLSPPLVRFQHSSWR